MLHYQSIALPSTKQIILPNCLFGISARQLELYLWRARPDSPTSSCQCLSETVSLNQRKWNPRYATLWQGEF